MTEREEGGVTKKVVQEAGDAAVEALKQGKRFGEAVQKEVIEPVTEAIGGYAEAKKEQWDAEGEAEVMERAQKIQEEEGISGPEALDRARQEGR